VVVVVVVVGSQRRGVVNSFNFPCRFTITKWTCVTIQITNYGKREYKGRKDPSIFKIGEGREWQGKKIITKPVSIWDAGFPGANWVCSRATKSLRNGNERVRRRGDRG
jgi:hypothetical protein